MSENVNHPKYYNSHPSGIECIDVIRHYVCDIANAIKYLWRAGEKPEMGRDDAEKEIEDLEKAIWYIEDYRVKIPQLPKRHFKSYLRMERIVVEVTGRSVNQIVSGIRDDLVSVALNRLLTIGIIRCGEVCVNDLWEIDIIAATDAIQKRILAIETALAQKELDSVVQVLHGQAVDGEDYISKPACRRATEPEHYDPLNVIIAFGTAYSLTDEPKKKENGAFYSPCHLCDLMDVCYEDWRRPDESQCRRLCQLHQATGQEYYRKVGRARYRPAFGTIEVVDERKELELELRQVEGENEDK